MNNIDRSFTPDTDTFVEPYIKYQQTVLQRVDTTANSRFIATLLEARHRGATVLFLGNGGSCGFWGQRGMC